MGIKINKKSSYLNQLTNLLHKNMDLRSFNHSMISQILILLITAKYCQGYFITIDANDVDCYYDRVKSGTKMGLIFEVAEGGALDIDVKLKVRMAKKFILVRVKVMESTHLQRIWMVSTSIVS